MPGQSKHNSLVLFRNEILRSLAAINSIYIFDRDSKKKRQPDSHMHLSSYPVGMSDLD